MSDSQGLTTKKGRGCRPSSSNACNITFQRQTCPGILFIHSLREINTSHFEQAIASVSMLQITILFEFLPQCPAIKPQQLSCLRLIIPGIFEHTFQQRCLNLS